MHQVDVETAFLNRDLEKELIGTTLWHWAGGPKQGYLPSGEAHLQSEAGPAPEARDAK